MARFQRHPSLPLPPHLAATYWSTVLTRRVACDDVLAAVVAVVTAGQAFHAAVQQSSLSSTSPPSAPDTGGDANAAPGSPGGGSNRPVALPDSNTAWSRSAALKVGERKKACPPPAPSPPLFPSTNTAPGSPTIHLPLPYREPASSPTGSLACHTVRLMAVTQVTDSSFTLDLDRYSAALADVAKAETAAGQAMASASGRAQYHPVPGVGIMHWARKTTDPALTVSACWLE